MPVRNPILPFCALLITVAMAQAETTSPPSMLIGRQLPEFPMSELRRNREGWVVVSYSLNDTGQVVNPSIEYSSGSSAFEKAAVKAVRDWRHEPGENQELSALLNFEYDRRQNYVSKKFYARYSKIHGLIDEGDLDAAAEKIQTMRSNHTITPVELAYSFIAEARIAGEREDRAEQLRCFRRAMLNEGRWLSRDEYLKSLRAAVALAISQGDLATAVRDYDLLTESETGKKLAANLEQPIEAIRARLDAEENVWPPYAVANNVVSIKHERLRHNIGASGRGPDPGGDDPATTPRPSKK